MSETPPQRDRMARIPSRPGASGRPPFLPIMILEGLLQPSRVLIGVTAPVGAAARNRRCQVPGSEVVDAGPPEAGAGGVESAQGATLPGVDAEGGESLCTENAAMQDLASEHQDGTDPSWDRDDTRAGECGQDEALGSAGAPMQQKDLISRGVLKKRLSSDLCG